MNLFKTICILFLLTFTAASCRKYVEGAPVQGQRVLVYTEDYRLLLNNREQTEIGSSHAAILGSDDADLTAPQIQSNVTLNTITTAMYTWGKPFYSGQNNDNDWGSLYSAIYTYNTVITTVMDSRGGDITYKNALLGEALLQRAFTYFTLTNMYGKQYDAATAGTDPAVPILLTPELFVDLTRASVAKAYDQILSDIQKAIPLLPLIQVSTAQPNKAAGYALLSKVYLNMRDFTRAAEFADSTLALSSQLYDYNTSIATTSYTFPDLFNDKQILLRKVPRTQYNPLQLSQSLLDLLGTKDLRYVLFVRPGNSFSPAFAATQSGFWSREKYSGGADKPSVGLTVNETWLIKAECLARGGKKDDAVKMLNDLRKLRFRPADYVPLAAATDQEALEMVVNERRREFFGSGLRWFDQRRLNKDAFFAKTVTRVFNNVTYTLEPNSNGYVFPLGSLLVIQNPEMVQNPN